MIDTIVLKFAAPCNLACSYCYEYFHGDDSWKKKPKKISMEVVEELAKKLKIYIKDNNLNNFNIVAHGGEPLLVGTKYFDDIFKTMTSILKQEKLNFFIQTNATLMNLEFIKLFQKYKINVGISLDGDLEANQLRIDHQGRSSWKRAIEGIKLMNSNANDLFSGILCVVNFDSNPEKVIECFHSLQTNMIDLLLPFYTHDSLNLNEKIKIQKQSLHWFREFFLYWSTKNKYEKIKIRIFEDAMHSVLTNDSKTDWFGHKSISYLVVQTDGSFDILDHLKVIGEDSVKIRSLNKNIFNSSLKEIIEFSSEQTNDLKLNNLPDDCTNCKWSKNCQGGYIPHRYSKIKKFNNRSFYCDTLYSIFDLSSKFLEKQNVKL